MPAARLALIAVSGLLAFAAGCVGRARQDGATAAAPAARVEASPTASPAHASAPPSADVVEPDSSIPADETAAGLLEARALDEVDAVVRAPQGWRGRLLSHKANSAHWIWISPTGDTAYGVIRFVLPLPVGHDLALWGFLREMRRAEGEAALISKLWDAERDALRFVADGGRYRLRTVMVVRGLHGWAVYAGTLRGADERADELDLAERAREATRLDATAESRAGGR